LDAARAGRDTADPPHAVLIAGSHALAAIVSAGAAVHQHVGDEDLALLVALLARLGTRLHAAESLDIPQAELLALADEIRQLAVEATQFVSSLPRVYPTGGT
jgi:cobalamin biosynthesis protein CbiD